MSIKVIAAGRIYPASQYNGYRLSRTITLNETGTLEDIRLLDKEYNNILPFS